MVVFAVILIIGAVALVTVTAGWLRLDAIHQREAAASFTAAENALALIGKERPVRTALAPLAGIAIADFAGNPRIAQLVQATIRTAGQRVAFSSVVNERDLNRLVGELIGILEERLRGREYPSATRVPFAAELDRFRVLVETASQLEVIDRGDFELLMRVWRSQVARWQLSDDEVSGAVDAALEVLTHLRGDFDVL